MTRSIAGSEIASAIPRWYALVKAEPEHPFLGYTWATPKTSGPGRFSWPRRTNRERSRPCPGRAGSLGRLRLLGPQASPCAMRGKRLLIIGYPKNRNYDVLDDGRPDIFIGHFHDTEGALCPHASRACQKINRGPTSMYDIGLRLI